MPLYDETTVASGGRRSSPVLALAFVLTFLIIFGAFIMTAHLFGVSV